MLTLQNLTVKAGDKTILNNLNFTFEKGKTYAVLGPNGSGKSTLSYTIMGSSLYQINDKSKIIFNNEDITTFSSDKRSLAGIFLSFQTPLAIAGVRVSEILQLGLQGQKDPLSLRKEINKIANELKINKELIERGLNVEASGGERKKMEVLQAAILNRNLQIFDEIDTGVDVDALKVIGNFLDSHKKDKTYIIITHYKRIFKYIKPDKVIVFINGQIKKIGGYELIHQIEQNGYEQFT